MALWQNKKSSYLKSGRRRKAIKRRGISSEARALVELFRAKKENCASHAFSNPCDNDQLLPEAEDFFIWYFAPDQLPAAKVVADDQTLELLHKFKKGVGPGWIVGPTHATLAEEDFAFNCMGVLIPSHVRQELEKKNAPGQFVAATDKYDLLMNS